MKANNTILSVTDNYLDGQRNPIQYFPLDPKYFYKYISGSWNGGYLSSGSYISDSTGSYDSGLDMLLGNKKQIVNSKIEMLSTEIYHRYRLKYENLYRIDQDLCECRNLMFQMGDFYLDRRRIDLEKKVFDLEQEKRRERALYFRDVSFLRKELRYSLIEQMEEKQKADLFANQQEELPWNG